jgi:hypothetical protein
MPAKILKMIKRWYQGKPIESDFLIGFYKRHWSAQVVHVLVEFYLKEWKWLLPFLVALAALLFKVL